MKIVFIIVSAFLLVFASCKKKNSEVDCSVVDFRDSFPQLEPTDNCYPIPSEANLEDVSEPGIVVGNGTPESCTCEEVVKAVAHGGIITFNCGSEPVTIPMTETAKVYNDSSDIIVIDGGGLVTLDGLNRRRILYMNTCDPSLHWTTSHCQNQEYPQLTIQNITFKNANSKGEDEYDGGGAIWVRGGRFKAVNCRFFNNVCADMGPDVGGGAIRAFSQYEGRTIYIVNCIFGGAEGYGNEGSNGGGISSIGVSWTIINSLFSYNKAVGYKGNPAQDGTSGGGSGGAIYNDGNEMTLKILGTTIENNTVRAYGSGIFFVTNNHTGNIVFEQSTIRNNTGGGWENVLPGVSMHEDTKNDVVNTTFE